jgi:ABC-type nitrate/sulfonate/bicarbonate transport system ATPase subunit
MPWLTLRENIAMGARLAGATTPEAAGRADTAIAALGLGGFSDHYPHALSGGMRQRAALARTMLSGRPTWLLDEPFGALDALTRAGMHDVLRDLRATEHPTILLVTHDVVEAVALCDRILVASPRPMRIVDDIRVGGGDRSATVAAVMASLRAAGALT